MKLIATVFKSPGLSVSFNFASLWLETVLWFMYANERMNLHENKQIVFENKLLSPLF
jgi:hypothetical protein